MALPHYENIQKVPGHLVTRAGLKQRGFMDSRPEPVATVLQFGKVVFLYDLRGKGDPPEPEAPSAVRRLRIKAGA